MWLCMPNIFFSLRSVFALVKLEPKEPFSMNNVIGTNITLSYKIAICFLLQLLDLSVLYQILFKYFSCCFSGIFYQYCWIGLFDMFSYLLFLKKSHCFIFGREGALLFPLCLLHSNIQQETSHASVTMSNKACCLQMRLSEVMQA